MMNGSKHQVLVTGGAGFIGRNLIPLLCNQGYQVRVLDNLSVGSKEAIGNVAELFVGDIRDRATVAQAVEGVDSIVHLAAHTNVIDSQKIPELDFTINAQGTLNLLLAAREQQVQRFIFASSNAPIGENVPPIDEEKPARPLSPYGASKLAGEGYCSAFYGSYGLGTIVFRFANVYGPGSDHKGSVVAKFVKDALETGTLTIYGDGQQTRDFIYVEDLCRAIVMGIESNCKGELFQIATGKETSIVELAQMITQTMPSQSIKVVHEQQRTGEIIKNYSSIQKVMQRLDWTPQMSLAIGIQKTVEWFLDR